MEKSPVRYWDVPAAGIMLALMLVSVARLGATKWADNLEYVQTLGVLGVLLGLVLGKSAFKRGPVNALSFGYSVMFVPWQLSRAFVGAPSLQAKLVSLGERVSLSLGEFFSNQPVEDTFLFVTLLAVIYWIAGLYSAFALTRYGNFPAAVIPTAVITVIVQVYDSYISQRIWLIALYILLVLLLQGRLNLIRQYSSWRKRRILLIPENNLVLNNGILITAAVIVALAWSLPTSPASFQSAVDAWRRIFQPWEATRERLGDVVAGVESPGGEGRMGYGRGLALGSGTELTNTVLFVVRVRLGGDYATHYYWRTYIYDQYENFHWSSSGSTSTDFLPDQGSLSYPGIENRQIIEVAVVTYIGQDILPILPYPIWASIPSELHYFQTQEGEPDLIAWTPASPLDSGTSYQVRSAVLEPTVEVLRNAGVDYPEWVVENYLQLPSDFSPRIRNLALEITDGLETPYDKAEAITTYLRQEITYAEVIPELPGGRDPLEWFLFDLKQGFCNYYASAEVLMLRALGIPARLAVGYAQGSTDERFVNFSVREKDSHAWPEVYFPGIGWEEFEPTTSLEPIFRPADEMVLIVPSEPGVEENELGGEDNIALPEVSWFDKVRTAFVQNPALWAISLLLVCGIVVLFWAANRRYSIANRLSVAFVGVLEFYSVTPPRWLKRWIYLARRTPIERAFGVVGQSLIWLGGSLSVADTPSERAAALSKLIPQAGQAIQDLLEEYHKSLYGPQPGDLTRARLASAMVRRYAIRTVFKDRISRLKQKLSPFVR